MNAVIYTRFSPRRHADTCESCQAQAESCRLICQGKGYNVLDLFHDEGYSGKNTQRPGLQQAMDLACDNQCILMVRDLSRLARKMWDCLCLVDQLNKAKAHFVSVKENFDTTSPGGRMIFHVFAALQEFEREIIAERTSDAMLRHIDNGRKMSSQPNYGYRFDGDRMIEDDYEQAVIERIHILRGEGLSLRKIADRLATESYTPRGRAFYPHLIADVLNKKTALCV